MAQKILIVDDDPETIDFLRFLLVKDGYEVIIATNGVQALHLAFSEQPNLIILDIMMPDIDGLEVARKLRSRQATAAIPILIYTAKNQIEDKVAGFDAGVDIYLAKPIHPVELQANIRTIIRSSARKEVATERHARGRLIGVMAAKGGLGVSTVALNLAISLRKLTKLGVIACELRPGQGSWGVELGIPLTSGLANLLDKSVAEINSQAVNDALLPNPTGVPFLLASDDPQSSVLASNIKQYEAILDQLRNLSEITILDIGTSFHPAYEVIIDRCDEILLVIEPQPICVKRTRQLIETLRPKGYGVSKDLSIVMVNRTHADMSFTLTQVEEALDDKVVIGIPPSGEQAYFAALKGIPLNQVQPEGLVAQQFNQLAQKVAQRLPQ